MDLHNMTADELYAEAERRGVKVGKKLRKSTIIEKLEAVKPKFDRAGRDALKRTPVTVFAPHRSIPEKVQLTTRAGRRHSTTIKKTVDGQTVRASKTIPKWGRSKSATMDSATRLDLIKARIVGGVAR